MKVRIGVGAATDGVWPQQEAGSDHVGYTTPSRPKLASRARWLAACLLAVVPAGDEAVVLACCRWRSLAGGRAGCREGEAPKGEST